MTSPYKNDPLSILENEENKRIGCKGCLNDAFDDHRHQYYCLKDVEGHPDNTVDDCPLWIKK